MVSGTAIISYTSQTLQHIPMGHVDMLLGGAIISYNLRAPEHVTIGHVDII